MLGVHLVAVGGLQLMAEKARFLREAVGRLQRMKNHVHSLPQWKYRVRIRQRSTHHWQLAKTKMRSVQSHFPFRDLKAATFLAVAVCLSVDPRLPSQRTPN